MSRVFSDAYRYFVLSALSLTSALALRDVLNSVLSAFVDLSLKKCFVEGSKCGMFKSYPVVFSNVVRLGFVMIIISLVAVIASTWKDHGEFAV